MSKRETPMILKYWAQVGGTLVEEFPMVIPTKTCGGRYADAIILPKRENRKLPKCTIISLEGEDVIIVQAKAHRLGMYLMGQALFSIDLVSRFKPLSIQSVALCTANDSELEPLLGKYPAIKVVVMPEFRC